MKISLFFISVFLFAATFGQNAELLKYDPQKVYSQEYLDSSIKSPKFPYSENDLKQILQSNKNLKGWVYYYNRMQTLAIDNKKYDSAFYYAEQAINVYENAVKKRGFDEALLIRTYNLRAYTFTRLKKFSEAIADYQTAIDLSKKHDYKWKSFLFSGIARSHQSMGNDSLALVYYKTIVKDTVYMNLDRPAVTAFTSIAEIFMHNQYPDSSMVYLKKALNKSLSGSYKDNLASIYGHLGFLYMQRDMEDSTLHYFNEAIDANQEYGLGNFRGAEEDHSFFKGYVAYLKGDFIASINHLNNTIAALGQFENITKSDKEIYLSAVSILVKIFKNKNEHQKANEVYEKTVDFLERFHVEQMAEEVQKLEITYQTKQKEESIAQLEASQAQQQTIIKQQRTIAFGLGGLLLLLSSLGYLFWRQNKLKAQYEKENLEQRLLRTQMNPHFIGNALNSISAMVTNQSKETVPYINKLSNLFRLVLNNSREEFVGLDEEIAALRLYLELESYTRDFVYNFNIDSNIDSEDVLIPPMLIQPLIENAIVHGFSNSRPGKSQVDISISALNNGLIKCMVTDNGTGYGESTGKTKKKHRSVSGEIIEERLAILKKKFKVDAKLLIKALEQGTQAELYLPYLLDQ